MGICLFLCAFGFAGLKLALIFLNVLPSSHLSLECRLVASGNIPDMQGVLILALNLTCWTKEAPTFAVVVLHRVLHMQEADRAAAEIHKIPAAFSDQDSNFTQSVKLTCLTIPAAYGYI